MKRLIFSTLICGIAVCLATSQGPARADDAEVRKERRLIVTEVSTYWIGVHAIPIDDAMKSQLKLEDRLIAAHVVPDSPASKAGLKQHDILLTFGESKITTLDDLVAAVKQAENNETEVQVLRGGEELTIKITPSERPEDDRILHVDQANAWRPLERWLGADNNLRGLRLVGPGVILGRKIDKLPEGLSISIEKKNDEPAKITVKRRGDEWQITEDSLDKLPEDLREHVKRHLDGPREHPLLGHSRAIFRLNSQGTDGEIHVEPRFLPEDLQPQLEKVLRQFQQRFNQGDPFKALEEKIEALQREVEKLREEPTSDDDDSDDGPEA